MNTPKMPPLPCPFCGNEPKVIDDLITFHVECSVCGSTGAVRSYESGAIETWNRRAAIEAQASPVQQEPVAWIRPSGKAMLEAGGYCTVYASDGMSNHSTPLYAHPAQQAKPKPITEQELKAGREAVTDDPDEQPDPWSFRMGVCFAERHHGIKE